MVYFSKLSEYVINIAQITHISIIHTPSYVFMNGEHDTIQLNEQDTKQLLEDIDQAATVTRLYNTSSGITLHNTSSGIT
jgi:hypothetical protein